MEGFDGRRGGEGRTCWISGACVTSRLKQQISGCAHGLARAFCETLGTSQLYEVGVKNKNSQQVMGALYIRSGRGLRMGPWDSAMKGGKRRRG